MLNRSDKEAIIGSLKTDIGRAQAVFLTNVIGIPSNDAVAIRKKIRDVKGKLVISRNTLLERAAQGTACEKLLTKLKGTNAVAFAFDDPAAVAKCLKDTGKELELVDLKGGMLGDKLLGLAEVKALAELPSRDQMLGTLLATFIAPVSALARVLHAIKEQKEQLQQA